MRVDLWVSDDLARRPEDLPALRWVAGWEDVDSASAAAAAERAWRVCNHGEQALDEDERAWREEWDRHANGVRLGVGDVVVADGRPLRCEARGFSPTQPPGG